MEEGGHYYKRDGSPCYEVPTKDGRMRGINLRWDRHLNLVPSVTTVMGIVAKPQLVRWKEKQAILAALTLPRDESWTEDDYIRRIREDSMRQAQEAADKGTIIHDQLEMDRDGRDAFVDDHWRPTCKRVRELLSSSFPDVDDWVAEEPFAHTSGYGGRVDLHSPSTGIVVDYKTKDGDFTDGKRLAYDQYIQLAAYHQGLRLSDNVCGNIFASRDIPGAAEIHVWDEGEIAYGKQVFNATLDLWKILKKYDPSFKRS